MEEVVISPRLVLKSITKAESGSDELAWLHEYRSDEKSTWWSITPRSKTLEDTQACIKYFMPHDPPDPLSRRVVFTVHEPSAKTDEAKPKEGKFVGLLTIKSLEGHDLPIPESFGVPAPDDPSILTVELAYGFLPDAWGKGYATESIIAALDACRKAKAFWEPYKKLYLRVIVNGLNPPSLRVMEKIPGMEKRGVFNVQRRVWLAGQWREDHELHIYGMYLLE